jgi:hypothetical protein
MRSLIEYEKFKCKWKIFYVMKTKKISIYIKYKIIYRVMGKDLIHK